MKTFVIITGICLLLIALFAVAVLMVCVIRIQIQDEKIADLRRDLTNVQLGGKEITTRMNRIETNYKH